MGLTSHMMHTLFIELGQALLVISSLVFLSHPEVHGYMISDIRDLNGYYLFIP